MYTLPPSYTTKSYRALVSGPVCDGFWLASGDWVGNSGEAKVGRLGGSERGKAGGDEDFGKHDCCRVDSVVERKNATKIGVGEEGGLESERQCLGRRGL